MRDIWKGDRAVRGERLCRGDRIRLDDGRVRPAERVLHNRLEHRVVVELSDGSVVEVGFSRLVAVVE